LQSGACKWQKERHQWARSQGRRRTSTAEGAAGIPIIKGLRDARHAAMAFQQS